MKNNYTTPEISFNKLFFVLFSFLAFSLGSFAQDVTITATGAGTYTVPAGITSITVECRGGGGGGAGANSNTAPQGYGGGAGGAYASSVIAVTPGQVINYYVGAGGAGGSGSNIAPGANGEGTWFVNNTTVFAQGGAGAPSILRGQGSSAASIGDTVAAGQSGVNGTTTQSGAGGNGANGGGFGGASVGTGGGNGQAGSAPGGGGSGAFVNNNTNRSGGNGARGQIEITLCTAPTITGATNILSTTATINWNATTPAPSTGYEYVVSTSNTAPGGAGTATTSTSANVTGLTASTTYYIFVRSDCGGAQSAWSGPVSFTTTVAGDEPCDAIPLTVGSSCGSVTGTTLGATPTTVTPNNLAGCGSHDGTEPDIWYTYTVPANGTVRLDAFINTNTDPVIAVYSGTCNGNLNLIACNDDAGVGLEAQLTLSGQTPGQTQYIRVWRYNNTQNGTVDVCATTTPSAPANDLCANATQLPCGTIDLAGTTAGATNVAHGTGCTISNYGVWYTFTGDGDLSIISVSPEAGYDVEVAVTTGVCGSLVNLNCVDNSGAGGVESYSFVTTNGERYYVYVAYDISGGDAFDTGSFTITRTCFTPTPPPNDDCSGAIDLIVNGSCVTTSGTTEYATPSAGVSNPSCSGYSGGDVWYTVTVPPSFGAELTIATQAGVVTDSGMAVYSGTCGGTLTELACENDSGMTSITLNNVSNGIVPGDILYIRVWETGNNNNGTFGICVTAPVPAGTNGVTICAGEASEPLSTDLFCNTGATSPYPLSGTLSTSLPQAERPVIFITSNDPCNFPGGLLRYYEEINFTVSATGTYVFDVSASFDTMGYIVEQGFTPGVCGSGTYIAGDDDTGPGLLSQITATLTQGVNYTLITTHYSSFASLGSYTWTVGLTPTSAEWYDAPTGGNLVGYGAFFDPVAAGVIADTNTPGTTSFYVACDGTSTRTQADFTITAGPISATATGSAGAGCSYDVTVNVNEPAGTEWVITYFIGAAENGGGVINTNPGVVSINEPPGTVISIRVYNSTTFCYVDVPGTLTIVGGGKVWNTNAASSNWFNANNWTPTGVPTSTDCVVIPDTSSGTGNDPIIGGTNDADAASITVQNGGILTVQTAATVTVQDEVTVLAGGTFELQGLQQQTAQLIQVNNATNTGNITLVREANVRTRDFVYWSSPVDNYSITNIGSAFRYEWIPTIPANAPTEHGNWQGTSEVMLSGKGYAVRGPEGNGNDDNTATWNTVTFTGVPRNGTITKAIERGSYTGSPVNTGGGAQTTNEDDNWNLVGNPYPSALDAVDFLTTNTNIEGTVYLWTHGTRIQQGQGSPFYGNYIYNYNIADYLEYNSSGGTQMGFDGFIASGQGFFIQMLDASSTPSTVTFDNTMRDRTHNNGQFFRSANPTEPNDIERHRIWLDLVEPSGNTNTTLVAYAQGATMEKDRLYDATTIGGNGKNIYSMLGEQPLIIQGRSLPFDALDQVPIGINVVETGVFAIAIHGVDGLFEETPQDIFINDLLTGSIHNLKDAPYFFTLDQAGEYNNRFILQYTNNALSSDEFETNAIVISAPNSSYIKAKSGNQIIDSIVVYDLHGRVLIDKRDINSQEVIINEVPQSAGTYLVKAILIDGSQKVQKIILK